MLRQHKHTAGFREGTGKGGWYGMLQNSQTRANAIIVSPDTF